MYHFYFFSVFLFIVYHAHPFFFIFIFSSILSPYTSSWLHFSLLLYSYPFSLFLLDSFLLLPFPFIVFPFNHPSCLSTLSYTLFLPPFFPCLLFLTHFFPSLPFSIFPSFPLHLFPSLPLSLFPLFPLHLSILPTLPSSTYPSVSSLLNPSSFLLFFPSLLSSTSLIPAFFLIIIDFLVSTEDLSGESAVSASRKLYDLIHLAELCVDLLQQNEEHHAEVGCKSTIFPNPCSPFLTFFVYN